jgi:hypothetical protein
LNDAPKIPRVLGDRGLRASILNNLGNLRSLQGRYDEAAVEYREAVRIADEVKIEALAAFGAAGGTGYQCAMTER